MTITRKKGGAALQRRMLYGLIVFLAGYGLLRLLMAGPADSAGLMRALHGWPALIACLFVVLLAPLRVGQLIKAAGADGDPLAKAYGLLLSGGLFLAAAGVLVSSQFRTEGVVLLTEGQAFEGREEEYILRSHYQAPFAGRLDGALTLESVSSMTKDQGIRRFAMRTVLDQRQGAAGETAKLTIRSVLPAYRDGVWYRVQDTGYAPSYSVQSGEGVVLDSAFVMLNVHPPGTEDAFRTLDLPHTIYVKYYPADRGASGDTASGARGSEEPTFMVRIVRNFDLLIERKLVRPNEPIDLGPVPGNVALAFHEVRKWAKIHIVRDPGLPLAAAGALALMGAAGAAGTMRIRKQGGRGI